MIKKVLDKKGRKVWRPKHRPQLMYMLVFSDFILKLDGVGFPTMFRLEATFMEKCYSRPKPVLGTVCHRCWHKHEILIPSLRLIDSQAPSTQNLFTGQWDASAKPGSSWVAREDLINVLQTWFADLEVLESIEKADLILQAVENFVLALRNSHSQIPSVERPRVLR